MIYQTSGIQLCSTYGAMVFNVAILNIKILNIEILKFGIHLCSTYGAGCPICWFRGNNADNLMSLKAFVLEAFFWLKSQTLSTVFNVGCEGVQYGGLREIMRHLEHLPRYSATFTSIHIVSTLILDVREFILEFFWYFWNILRSCHIHLNTYCVNIATH